jgi:hypothetical protein
VTSFHLEGYYFNAGDRNRGAEIVLDETQQGIWGTVSLDHGTPRNVEIEGQTAYFVEGSTCRPAGFSPEILFNFTLYSQTSLVQRLEQLADGQQLTLEPGRIIGGRSAVALVAGQGWKWFIAATRPVDLLEVDMNVPPTGPYHSDEMHVSLSNFDSVVGTLPNNVDAICRA